MGPNWRMAGRVSGRLCLLAPILWATMSSERPQRVDGRSRRLLAAALGVAGVVSWTGGQDTPAPAMADDRVIIRKGVIRKNRKGEAILAIGLPVATTGVASGPGQYGKHIVTKAVPLLVSLDGKDC